MPTPRENHDLAQCFGCGTDNPHGLHMHLEPGTDGVRARIPTSAGWVSWRGVTHGGLIATVMDEAMGWALAYQGFTGLTARLSVRYLRPAAPGATLCVHAWVTRARHGVAQASAEVSDAGGSRLATADGLLRIVEDVAAVAPRPGDVTRPSS